METTTPVTGNRERFHAWVVYATAVVAIVVLVHRFRLDRGPWFDRPETLYDHVWWGKPHPLRNLILLAEEAERTVPRGSTVTALSPYPPHADSTFLYAAGGLLPRHRIVFTDATPPADFMLVPGGEYRHPSYRLWREHPSGRIYELIR